MPAGSPVYLSELVGWLPDAEVAGLADGAVQGLECDSRRVGPGCVFVAIRGGQERDRHQYVGDAVARGAIAVVVEEPVEAGAATRVKVADTRKALAQLAAHYYGRPADHLITAAITGTNGKTTTALLLRAVLEAAGVRAAYMGTMGSLAGGRWRELANTTPEAGDLHRELRAAVDAGDAAVVMEVSSHALTLGRIAGLQFDVAAFTNLTRDHLDFHGSEEAYFDAKASLFEHLKGTSSPGAVVNADDPYGRKLLDRVGGAGLSFAMETEAQIRPRRVEYTPEGMELDVVLPRGELAVRASLTGPFNCSNILAAVACGVALDLEPEAIGAGIASVEQIPGRFERVDEGQGFLVIVDYAHTPDGLANVLRAARALAAGKLICLFGCGGDRDRGKRPLMGQVAEALADVVVVTSDNPRGEGPDAIIADIAAGMSRPEAARRVTDRESAIEIAIEMAHRGDVIVLAGKGDEDYQAFADRVIDFDDRLVARRVLSTCTKDS